MPIVIAQPSYRDLVRTLWEFDGWRCVGRILASALAFALVPLAFVAATVLAAYIAGDDFALRTAVVAAVVGAAGPAVLAPLLARQEPHRKVIEKRVRIYQRPNPTTEVPVLVRASDGPAACRAIRRARFNPWATRKLPAPPSDTPDLNYKIAVHEPEVWRRSTSDDDRSRRVVAVLENAGIPARVGAIDTAVRPSQPRA